MMNMILLCSRISITVCANRLVENGNETRAEIIVSRIANVSQVGDVSVKMSLISTTERR